MVDTTEYLVDSDDSVDSVVASTAPAAKAKATSNTVLPITIILQSDDAL